MSRRRYRVAIVTESFLPTINGVTNSVTKTLDHLHKHHHEAIIIAPKQPGIPTTYRGFPIITTPTINLNLGLPIGLPTPTITRTLRNFQPDIAHLASPFLLGAAAAFACQHLSIPTIAIFQTNIADYTTRYHLPKLKTTAWRWITHIHNHCDLTLAPSTSTITELRNHGITTIKHWGRGVDTTLFNPDHHQPDPTNHIIGYVGRLAPEKGLHRLRAITNLPNTTLTIVGTGPLEPRLRKLLPTACFLGPQTGTQLAHTLATFDIFIHPGEFETFCQTIQEAHAAGVPTIAPNTGGPQDLITNGHNGYLLGPTRFERDLPHAINAIYANHHTMSHNARAGVENRTWETICSELIHHYEAVIHNPTRYTNLRG